MPDLNPDDSSVTSDVDAESTDSEDVSSGRAAYNIVSDTVIGLNTRKGDNKFQAVFILLAVVLFAGIGSLLASLNGGRLFPWFAGTLVGALIGLVGGLFASGIILMFYRGIQHLKGKHQ